MNPTIPAAENSPADQVRFWLLPLAAGLGLLGLTLSYSVFDVVNKNREARLENEFRLEINRRLAKLDQELVRSAENLASVATFFRSTDHVDAAKFRNFTAGYLRHHAGPRLLGWAPAITSVDDFDQDFENSQIAGMSLPLSFIEPGPLPEINFGSNLLAIPGMSTAVETVFRQGGVEGFFSEDRLILITPTLENADWSGVVFSVLPVETLKLWIGLEDLNGSISIIDERTERSLLKNNFAGDQAHAYVVTVSFGTETWRVTAMPMPGQIEASPSWATLAAGIIITVLLLSLIIMLVSNAKRSEKLVRLRTSELEQAEAEARGQAARLADQVAHTNQVISSIPSILIGVDTAGLITQWNSAIQQVSGIAFLDVMGRHIGQSGWSGDTGPLTNGVNRCIAEETEVRLDNLVFAHSDGSDATIGMTAIPMRDSEGRLDGCLIIGADITDKNKMEIQLREAQRLEAVGRLAAGIAHEVNTPAQFVSDNTTFLKEAFDDLIGLEDVYNTVISEAAETLTDNQKQRVTDAQQAADRDFLLEEVPHALAQSMDGIRRIADIVRAMKEFSHPGGGGGKEQVDFNRLITNAITVAANEWKYYAEIETDLDKSLPPLACFPRELNQVVLNLLINAAHAIADSIGDGGNRGKVTIRTLHDENFVQMRLTDTGTGIPVHVRDKIFEPFFTTKEVGRGSGQGLALAYSAVVEQHGGQLSFETELGVGTTFIVNLPLKTQEAVSEAIA